MATVYVPILKGKEGEYGALEALTQDVREVLLPLVEVPTIPFDFISERSAKTLEEHLSPIPARLKRAMHTAPVLLDLNSVADSALISGTSPFVNVFSACSEAGVACVPTLTLRSGANLKEASALHNEQAHSGVALRLQMIDFQEDVDLHPEIDRVLAGTRVASENSVDLIADLGDLGNDTGRAVLVARSVFSMLPRRNWRRVIIAGASFPEDLSAVDAKSTSTLPRVEWDLWNALQKRPSLLPRADLIFADYGISHPIPRELDPRTMRMSASIRYTTEQGWLILKGRNVRQFGFEQFFELCRELVTRPEYSGRGFSWGDTFISDCADAQAGPGNATTWRKVGVNHHMTLLSRLLAIPRHAA